MISSFFSRLTIDKNSSEQGFLCDACGTPTKQDFDNKAKSAICPVFDSSGMLFSVPDKAELFAEIFSKNVSRDDSGISLAA